MLPLVLLSATIRIPEKIAPTSILDFEYEVILGNKKIT